MTKFGTHMRIDLGMVPTKNWFHEWPGSVGHGGIRYGALSSQRSHSNAYAVLSPLAATLLMAQTQSIIVTCTGFHAFGT